MDSGELETSACGLKPVNIEQARRAIGEFRDATREGRVIGFRQRDELVCLLHGAIDELEKHRRGA